jgi:hypothetical protein
MIAMKTIDFGVARPESSKGVEAMQRRFPKTQETPSLYRRMRSVRLHFR